MCDYCKNGVELEINSQWDIVKMKNIEIRIEIDHLRIDILESEESVADGYIDINFCPMCGKELGV